MPEHETLRWLKAIGLYEQEKYVESLKMLNRIRDEKLVMNILKDNSPMDLNELKGQTGLSNKKWEKGIPGALP